MTINRTKEEYYQHLVDEYSNEMDTVRKSSFMLRVLTFLGFLLTLCIVA